MAALHGTYESNRTQTKSFTGTQDIKTMVETWQVRIVTLLEKDGKYSVVVMDRETGKTLHEVNGYYLERTVEA